MPNSDSTFSWSSQSARPVPNQRRFGAVSRVRQFLSDFAIFDLLATVALVGLYDFLALVILSGYQSTVCGGYCGLRMQLHLLRQGEVLVPLILAVPVVLVLLMRRRRTVVAVVQIALCLVLTMNNLADQRTTLSHLNGTATCWNSLYSPKDCPWGDK